MRSDPKWSLFISNRSRPLRHAMSICTLCKSQICERSPEPWTAQDGQVVHVTHSVAASVVAETSLGELEICESCYLQGLPSHLAPQDLAEIHYQFGLEYGFRNQFIQSVEAITRARGLVETADILASLAHSENELGHRALAIEYYRRALEIDPSHFMSRENLRLLRPNAL